MVPPLSEYREWNSAAGCEVTYRRIPLWIATQKETLGAVRKRRAYDYAAACRWRPLLSRVLDLEAEIRVLKGEPKWPALPSPAEWAARQARLDAEGDAPFVVPA